VELVRLRGQDDGGSAIETALLVAAMTLVLVPVLYALGHTAYEALDAPCNKLTGESCDEVNSGPGGIQGGIERNEARRANEQDVADEWSRRNAPKSAEGADCPGLKGTPPAEDTAVDCTVTTSDGDVETITVTWQSDGSVVVP
jgi:Flp pilus assembly pilin Flp